MWNTPEYKAWSMMLQRCENPKAHAFEEYGGRGIAVCERWHDFNLFIADMGLRPSAAHSLDRQNNDGNYCPENCRWATAKEQQNNRRVNRMITFEGQTKNLQQWAESLGMSKVTLHARLRKGWTIDRALTTPINPQKRNKVAKFPVIITS